MKKSNYEFKKSWMSMLLFIFSVSMLFFSFTFNSAAPDFSSADPLFIAIITFIVCSTELLLSKVFRQTSTRSLFLALCIFLNIISLNLLLNSKFIDSPLPLMALYCVIAVFILYTFINIVRDNKILGLFISVSVLTASIFMFWNSLLELRYEEVPNVVGMTSSDNIKLVEFEEKPNVYIISFDALIPKTIYQKQFSTDDSTAYHSVLDDHFYKFKNFFADGAPTKRSLSSLIMLDNGYYSMADRKFKDEIFSGVVPSPLFEIFKHNGYVTNTLYQNGYFGRRKGPYVDNYFFSDKLTVACKFLPESVINYAFFGYCAFLRTQVFTWFYRNFDLIEELDPVIYLLGKMRNGLNKINPQIFVAYVYSPGHTEKYYKTHNVSDLLEYKNFFDKSSNTTARYIESLINFVRDEDPDAILYIFGDHGSYMSRTIEFEDDNVYFIQDRFAVFGGVYPKERCMNSLMQPYQAKYTTAIQGVYMILRCLTGGDEDVFIEERDFSIQQYGRTKGESSYETYLYE